MLLRHTQWLLLMWTIWKNGPVIILNCRTEPREGLWNPCMPLLILLSIMCASCMITQSSHPFGEAIRPYSWCPSLPSSSCLSQGHVFVMTVFRIITSSVSELTVGLVTVLLVFVVTCVTVGLVLVEMCVVFCLVCIVLCVTVCLECDVTCVTVWLVFVVTCVRFGLVFVEVCVTVCLVCFEAYVSFGLEFGTTLLQWSLSGRNLCDSSLSLFEETAK